MKVTVQVVIEAENGTSTMVQEVGQLEREGLQPENLGLKLVEAKDLLQAVLSITWPTAGSWRRDLPHFVPVSRLRSNWAQTNSCRDSRTTSTWDSRASCNTQTCFAQR